MTTQPQDAHLTIVQLTAENVKRLKAVQVTPDGNLVVLSGRNAQGKSSVLDAIEYALAGKGSLPDEPVRRGEESARVVVDLGQLIVTRRFVAGGGSELVVTNRAGLRFTSPQTMLDELVGALTFDPLAFSRMKPEHQLETLRALVGIDFRKDDNQHADMFAERTAVNREEKALRSRLAAMPHVEGVPDDVLSAADLATKLQAAQQANSSIERARQDGAALSRRLEALRRELAAGEAELERLSSIAKQDQVDTAPMVAQIQQVDRTNAVVRGNQQRAQVAKEHAEKVAESKALTDRLDAIEQRKAATIAGAKMPVPGLGLTERGVTLNNLPLAQASSAEQLRVSVAIGLAMNPRLRVLLIRDGSLLDHDSLRLIAEMAREACAQLWVERVEIDAATSVVIEDGLVNTPPEAK